MLRDAIENLMQCSSGFCFAWHGALGGAALLLGLWFAYEIWCRPFWAEARIYQSAVRDRAESREQLERESRKGPEMPGAGGGVRMGGGPEKAPLLQAADRARRQREMGVPDSVEPLGWKAVELASRPSGSAFSLVEEEPGLADVDRAETGPAGSGSLEESGKRALAERGADTGEKASGNVIELQPWLEPEGEDDLTLIEGISGRLRRELNSLGIFRFEQLASWQPAEAARVAKELGVGDAIPRQNWMEQAAQLQTVFRGELGEADLGWSNRAGGVEMVYRGESVRMDERWGLVFDDAPEVRDDLTEIHAVSPALERKLAALGIYRLKQVAAWTPGQVGAVEEELPLEGGTIVRERWRQQAERLHRRIYRASSTWTTSSPPRLEYEQRLEEIYGGVKGGAVWDERLGIVYRSEPAEAEDLTLLPGIGEVLAAWLRDCGIYRFQQIADWSMDNVKAFAARLDLPAERILQERWIPRAAALAEGRPLLFPTIFRKFRA